MGEQELKLVLKKHKKKIKNFTKWPKQCRTRHLGRFRAPVYRCVEGGPWMMKQSKKDPPSHICSEGGSVGVSLSKNGPPTRVWSEGGSVGVSLSKKDPPTCVCSEGGSVGVVERPTISHLEARVGHG